MMKPVTTELVSCANLKDDVYQDYHFWVTLSLTNNDRYNFKKTVVEGPAMPLTLFLLYFVLVNTFWIHTGLVVNASVCPNGAKEVGNICLKYHEGSYVWSEARSYCKSNYGTDLLVVRNDALFSDIQNAVQNRRDHGFWVGATRKGNHFEWVNSSPCCGSYWNPSEPNGAQGSGDDCVHVWNSGSARGLNDVKCDDQIGFICEECPEISHCVQRHCTNIHDTVCDKCEDDKVFYKRTTSNTLCERMCSFDNHACWPGTCSNELTSSCACAPGFQRVKDSNQTVCQLKDASAPSINTCQTVIGGANGEAKRTALGKCQELNDFFGNFQPTSVGFDMQSDFILDVTKYSSSRPKFIKEEKFGITDTTLYIKRVQIDGTQQTLGTFKQKIATSQSTNVETTVAHKNNYTLSQPNYKLTNGDRLCVQFEARGGGYVKRNDFRTQTVKTPLPYQKTSTTETVCYRYDDAKPQHCLVTRTCSLGEKEPIQISHKVTRTSIIPVSFSGWKDPIPVGGNTSHASDIESYEITVNEVNNGIVDSGKVFSCKMNHTQTTLTLNLTSDSPRLYSVNLEVKDAADNVRQARRFVLYDSTTNITSRPDKPFTVSSASMASNYTWQTHHNDICLNWTDHFYNQFYMDNLLLGKINSAAHGLITGIYEQQTGLLPVNGTSNVHGIVQYKFSWSLDGVISPIIVVPKLLDQLYCHSLHLKDGQTYILNIEAIDIVNNTLSENRTVFIDRSVPHINNIWLMKNGIKRLYVHDDIDLSAMNMTFEALDPHSGLLNIEWTFKTIDSRKELGSGVIGIVLLEKEHCPKNQSDSCYCPDVGKCEHFKYSIPLNKLVQSNKHIGNHNRNYMFTIKVTNNARLSNIEHIDILVDDSPPELGVVYEGAIGTHDIDYTSDNSYIARWHGFIDHESGIKEYRLGLADTCVSKEQLIQNGPNSTISEYTTVLHTESSVRVRANFTGKKYISIIAINNALEPSEVACSDGLTRDNAAPIIQNVHIESGKWAESIFCSQGKAWILKSDLKRLQLSETDGCNERCINNTMGSDVLGLLPTITSRINDTDVDEFMCKNLPIYDAETIIYLPNDNIFLSWNIDKGLGQIEDYYVGFGQTSGNSSALTVMDFKSTGGKQYFQTRHIGIGSGDLFYVHMKVLSKTHMETVSVIGPVMIDETPPYFREKTNVTIDGDMLLVGWNDDTIYDLEQKERINQIYFQIVHGGMTATPLLEWRFDASESCPRYTGGCFKYPLKRLQRIDTDFGQHFSVRVYAYNNAGHFTLNETESFLIPSRYPPGHAVVSDLDPEDFSSSAYDLYQDVNVHFTANKICTHWNGFKHHENVTIEVGLGTNKTEANTVPFQHINSSKETCIQSSEIHFNIQYYVLLRATCSGGNTISTSNGITIINKTDLLKNIDISVGEHFIDVKMNPVDTTYSKICSLDDIEIGAKYKLILYNVTLNVSVSSEDMIFNDRTYDKGNSRIDLNIVPYVKRPCISVDSNISEHISAVMHRLKSDGFVSDNKMLFISWNYSKHDILNNLNFRVALATFPNKSYTTEVMSIPKKSSEHMSHSFDLKTVSADGVHAVAVIPCTNKHCLNYTLSPSFQIEHAIKPGQIKQAIVTVEGGKDCVDIRIAWQRFEAKSTITIYQWSLSRDYTANTLLTGWKAIKGDLGTQDYQVDECLILPVHGHSTMYVCVKAFSAVGNAAIECRKTTTIMNTEYNRDAVYDIDMTSKSWAAILEMIHSSNIGSKYALLHDAEVDFGTTTTVISGVMMHATERNVSWYLMRKSDITQLIDCDKDKYCVLSATSDTGFMAFDSDLIERNHLYYICAYSNVTLVAREAFTEELTEIRSCSNGFIIDDIPPTDGRVTVRNTGGFLSDISAIDIAWRGFDDNADVEKLGYRDGIKYYSYAIGNRPGGSEVRNYTIVGNIQKIVERNIDVVDGTDIYVTVKATDQAGLSTTVTSSQLIVDTSPPVSGTVILNDARGHVPYISSTFCTVTLNGFMDHHSGIYHFEVGIGSDEFLENVATGLVYKTDRFEINMQDHIHDGHKYYVSVKAVNRAGISSAKVSVPFILDLSPPTGGHVVDGNWKIKNDLDYQMTLGYIQGHWYGFVDQQSGIKYYRTCLGTKPYMDNIEKMVNVGLRTDILWNGTYHSGTRYYITVEACNTAGLCRVLSSDGLILDNSPPIHGIVRVGSGNQHRKYLPHGGTVHIQYTGFEDPQSEIDHYETCIGSRPRICNILPFSTSLLESSIIKTGLNLSSGISFYASVRAFNKAGMQVTSTSDAFQIDSTAPVSVKTPSFSHPSKSLSNMKVQWEKSVLRMSWKFTDEESKVASHIISLKTHHEGHTPVEQLHVGNVDSLTINLDEHNWLHGGDKYYFVVTSCNVAGLCASAQSENLLIDSTPPHLGGFKPPMAWQNFIDQNNKKKSRLILSWYGFADAESSIDSYYLKVSRNYTGHELSQGEIIIKSTNTTDEQTVVTIGEQINPDDLLILTLWANNVAGLNSTMSRITVSALLTGSGFASNSTGILEIQKHSCDVHFCNKDCTCAIVGKQCVNVHTNESCNSLNKSDIASLKLTEIDVYGGLPENPENMTVSSACLSGYWIPRENDHLIQRYEWSMGIKDQPVGEGVFNLKVERPWKDVGKNKQAIYCLPSKAGLKHDTKYLIYVRAWYAKDMYATFTSAPFYVDQTPPHQSKGKFIKDSDSTCKLDFDTIDWMDYISACWDGVFTERQGRITHYFISLGTSLNGSDIFPRTNVDLATYVTLTNLTLTHGTRYFFTVTAFNNVGLHTSISSDGFAIDMDTPVSGVVFNTDKHTNMAYQSSDTTFNISWHGFHDIYSGIKSYHVAIVKDPVEDYKNISFTNVGLHTKHIFRNIKLKHGELYKGLVKSFDNAGHVSNVSESYSRRIDLTPPSVKSCEHFEKYIINQTSYKKDKTIEFSYNFSANKYYVISGGFSDFSVDKMPVMTIGRHSIYLPITLYHNGSAKFEYDFMSPMSGMTTINIATNTEEFRTATLSELMVMRCSALLPVSEHDAVKVKQIGSSKIAVSSLITDEESSLYKVLLGIGTTSDGFQIQPLSPLHGGISGVIDVDVEHNTLIYTTVLSENHAGLRSVFKGHPVRFDQTPPLLSNLEAKVTVNPIVQSGNKTEQTLNIFASWTVADYESGVKYCLCGIGKSFSRKDMDLRLSDSKETCIFSQIYLQHGDKVFVSVKCINNVELATSMISETIIISTESPDISKAEVRIISPDKRGTTKPNQGLITTYVVADRSHVQLEWEGFEDMSGVNSYEYRVLYDNHTIVDWKNTSRRKTAEINDLDLDPGKVYKAEVRAVNSGNYVSDSITAGLVIQTEPSFTGNSVTFVKKDENLKIDWSKVFRLDGNIDVTYDVTIGTRFGFSDVLELRNTDNSHCEILIPLSTIVTPKINELFVSVTCTYSTGLSNVFNTNFKI
ncbi:uncharacterized protein LOC123528459 [Mercenaria mercenaria]|uniref:uncharacterized protein LOC123528459 n=1 Tax=Mercenaria mercenaria TaxID=6596 RepID=UPI00234F4F1D|nr:uncharacterized protein LOC123528459 [Mercenaria mercenaria]